LIVPSPLRYYIGSFSVWKVDMKPSPPNVAKIAGIPQTTFLNGMITLDGNGNVLIADSAAGAVWRLDTSSGESQIVINDPLMKAPAGGPQVGINGIGISKNTLYFTNSFAFTFNRIPINSDGTPSGPSQTVAPCQVCDDFALDGDGNAFVAVNPGNELQKITADGVSTVLVGNLNSTELAGPSSVRFGRKGGEGNSVVYITTCGGLVGPVNGTFVEGGKVVSVDLCD
jgi:sugar lactone lactonase YvrE